MSCEAIHCFDRQSVRFAMYPEGPNGPRVLAEVAEDALRDLYGARGGGESLIAACRANFDEIENRAIERYRAEPRRAIRLTTSDLAPRYAPASIF